MELLSPAGSMACLIGAVQNGADAVYFGGGSFNARRFANNFSGDELIRAVDYCHERGVRCYITVNTLLFGRELAGAVDFAAELYRLGADAVLVQDLGLARLLRQELPELKLHASTQMGIHDLGGLEYCRRIGITRAVLAREVSLEGMEYLAKNSDIEIETFAHGALCMSFSGSCLYSSMSGERSGNRGTCAQPCRKRASVSGMPGMNDFCLSPNDICMLDELDALKRAGVACVKLEGRMKKPEYVAAVTRCYRAALDGASAAERRRMRAELFELFNRGDFNTAHLRGDSVRTDRVGSSKPGRELIRAAERSVQAENRRRDLRFELKLRVGESAYLGAALIDAPECSAECSGAIVQRANTPQKSSNYADRLGKLGDTPFSLRDCAIDMEEDCYISAAELNALRRAACLALLEAAHIRNEVPEYAHPRLRTALPEQPALGSYVRVRTAREVRLAFDAGAEQVGIEPIYFNAGELEVLKTALRSEEGLILILPNVLMGADAHAGADLFIESGVFRGLEINNIGQWELGRALPIRIAGIGLNTLNAHTADELLELGFTHIFPSPVLSAPQLRELAKTHAGVLIPGIHGRVPLMQLLHCPMKEHMGCKHCSGSVGRITDEAGREFPLINTRFRSGCLLRMLNCHTTDLVDIFDELPSCAGYALSFIGEDAGAIAERMNAFRAASGGKNGEESRDKNRLAGSTRGHWNRKLT